MLPPRRLANLPAASTVLPPRTQPPGCRPHWRHRCFTSLRRPHLLLISSSIPNHSLQSLAPAATLFPISPGSSLPANHLHAQPQVAGVTHFFYRSVPYVHLQRDNHQPDLPSVHRCHPGSFNNIVPSRSMPQLGRFPSQPFHTPWMFMLLWCIFSSYCSYGHSIMIFSSSCVISFFSPKWQICSAAYGIIELHLFVLSLFPCSSSGTAILCLLFDRYLS